MHKLYNIVATIIICNTCMCQCLIVIFQVMNIISIDQSMNIEMGFSPGEGGGGGGGGNTEECRV